jgi:transcriptional regulator with XRE-family HTH domain
VSRPSGRMLAERLTVITNRYQTRRMTTDVPRSVTGRPAEPGTLSEHVAAEIRADLGRQGISQRQLAVRLGVSPMWVSGRLSGETAISLDDIVLMAAGLGRPVSYFLPASIGEVLDVEVIRSRPLRSRPVGHVRTVKRVSGAQPTHEYAARAARPTRTRPISRPPNRPVKTGPNGHPSSPVPDPTTRRPARLPSTGANREAPSRSTGGNWTRSSHPLSIMSIQDEGHRHD